jgi:hypothetical protein
LFPFNEGQDGKVAPAQVALHGAGESTIAQKINPDQQRDRFPRTALSLASVVRDAFRIALGERHQHADPPHPLGLLARATSKKPATILRLTFSPKVRARQGEVAGKPKFEQ